MVLQIRHAVTAKSRESRRNGSTVASTLNLGDVNSSISSMLPSVIYDRQSVMKGEFGVSDPVACLLM